MQGRVFAASSASREVLTSLLLRVGFSFQKSQKFYLLFCLQGMGWVGYAEGFGMGGIEGGIKTLRVGGVTREESRGQS